MRPVTRVFVTPDEEVMELSFQRLDGTVETITATPGHPFWVEGQGWVEARDLRLGATVQTAEHGLATLSATLSRNGRTTVYNLEVDGTHTYFVGETGAWVHNACGCGGGNHEVFYRTMSRAHARSLMTTGKVSATSETFISPSRAYSEAYDGALVELRVRPGTTEQLAALGVRDRSSLTAGTYPNMPVGRSGWPSTGAYFKAESGQINIGLGRGPALELFNQNMTGYNVVRW